MIFLFVIEKSYIFFQITDLQGQENVLQ